MSSSHPSGRLRWAWLFVGLAASTISQGGCVQLLGDFELEGGPGGAAATSATAGGEGGSTGLADGETCTSNEQCDSMHCADEVCCATACDDGCSSCALSGTVGICSPHSAGTDPDDECGEGACDGSGACASAEHVWSKSFGPDGGLSLLEVDQDGQVVIAGLWEGNINLGDGPIMTPGSERQTYYARFDANGALLHHRVISTDGTNLEFRQMALDASGATYLLGVIEGTSGDVLRVDGVPYPTAAVRSSLDMVVGKIEQDGTIAWFRSYGASTGSFFQPYGIAVDSMGRPCVTGVTAGNFDLGGGPVDGGMLVARLGPQGAHDWSFGYENAQPQDLTVDEAGNVVVAGTFESRIAFQGKNLDPLGNGSFFLVEFDGNSGSHVWSDAYGDNVNSGLLTHHIATAPGGDLCVAGTIRGNVDFGGGSFDAPMREGFMARFSTNGEHRWSYHLRELVPGGFDGPSSAASDVQGNCLFAGHYVDAPDFGAGAMPSSGGRDLFVAKYDLDGTLLVARNFGDAADQEPARVAAGPDGSIHLAGAHTGATTIDFGGGPLARVFLAKLSP